MVRQTLSELATKHGTDKWGVHWYAQHYDIHFSPYRDQAVNLLEIGVGGYQNPEAGGESLRMWQDYFAVGNIYGLDIEDKSRHASERIKIYRGSQDDRDLLLRMHSESGGFDFIVDDGSHINRHVIQTFFIMFPLLKSGGIYAIEDLQTAYWPSFGGAIDRGSSRETSMSFLKSLVDGLNFQEFHRPEIAPSYFEQSIVSIHFYHNLCFLYKGLNNESSNIVRDNRLPPYFLQE